MGMGATGSQLEDVRKANGLEKDMPVFTLQGGFDIRKLRGVYKLMMKIMSGTVGKKLAEKKERTREENEMLELLISGGNRVSAENLTEVINWYREAD